MNPNRLLCWKGRIFVPDQQDLCVHILHSEHDHVLADHLGQSKILYLIRKDYYWPKLCDFVIDYIQSCNTCMCNKAKRHRPYGLLKQLSIPPQPWNSISMDFIEQLPQSGGFMEILVIIDRLTKQAVFIPTQRSIDTTKLAKLFIQYIFSKHGVLSHITSNRGSKFIWRFFRSVATLLQMKLHYTSGYHPEADGQTERTNQTLEQYLRIYCNYQKSD